jgi:hypothetical protein
MPTDDPTWRNIARLLGACQAPSSRMFPSAGICSVFPAEIDALWGPSGGDGQHASKDSRQARRPLRLSACAATRRFISTGWHPLGTSRRLDRLGLLAGPRALVLIGGASEPFLSRRLPPCCALRHAAVEEPEGDQCSTRCSAGVALRTEGAELDAAPPRRMNPIGLFTHPIPVDRRVGGSLKLACFERVSPPRRASEPWRMFRRPVRCAEGG